VSQQLSSAELQIWTVAGLTSHIRGLLYDQPELRRVWVRGELSNLRCPPSGHRYFTLKDASSSLPCVMFRGPGRTVAFNMQDGIKVIAYGYIDVYEKAGQYQLYVQELQPDGMGSLHLALQQLRRRLQEEGLFSADRKRPLPSIPQAVGVVTSRSGAALRDILRVAGRRFPGMNILLSHSSVQGDRAPQELVEALQRLEEAGAVDVIIIGRGGGSLEELWCFNDERVVRAVAACSIPVVSAVGHETDVSLCDLAADARAATPSAAAELVVPDRERLFRELGGLSVRLERGIGRLLDRRRRRLADLGRRRVLVRPEHLLIERRQRLDTLLARIAGRAHRLMNQRRLRLVELTGRLHTSSPLGALERGFSLVRREDGQVVRSWRQVEPGDLVGIQLSLGSLNAEVRETCPPRESGVPGEAREPGSEGG